jgi:hypothetical protein
MNTPPIVSPEAWEAARQQMLAKEKAARDGLAAENHLRSFPPGPLPYQTEVPARPAASADTTADTQAGEMAQAGPRAAYEFEGPNGRVSPTALGNQRALSRFLIVLCGAVAATLTWWSYGDAARCEMGDRKVAPTASLVGAAACTNSAGESLHDRPRPQSARRDVARAPHDAAKSRPHHRRSRTDAQYRSDHNQRRSGSLGSGQ